MTKMRAWSDPVENITILDQLNLKYRIVKEVPFSKIDFKASCKKQYRGLDNAIDTAHLEDMRPFFADRSYQFPMMVVVESNKGYEICSGIHRAQLCIEEGITHVDLVVIKGEQDKEKITDFSIIANLTHGLLVSKEVPKQRAYERYKHEGLKPKDLSELFKISTQTLWNYIKEQESRERLRNAGKPSLVAERLGVMKLEMLSSIKNDVTFKRAAEFLNSTGTSFTNPEAKKFIQTVREKPSEKAADEYISSREKSLQESGIRASSKPGRKDDSIKVVNVVVPAVRTLQKHRLNKLMSALIEVQECFKDAESTASFQATDPNHVIEISELLGSIYKHAIRLKLFSKSKTSKESTSAGESAAGQTRFA